MLTTFPDYTAPQPDLEATRAEYVEFHRQLESAESGADCAAIVEDWDRSLCRIKEWASVTYIRFQQDTRNEAYKSE